jgi:hypothetical protein
MYVMKKFVYITIAIQYFSSIAISESRRNAVEACKITFTEHANVYKKK